MVPIDMTGCTGGCAVTGELGIKKVATALANEVRCGVKHADFTQDLLACGIHDRDTVGKAVQDIQQVSVRMLQQGPRPTLAARGCDRTYRIANFNPRRHLSIHVQHTNTVSPKGGHVSGSARVVKDDVCWLGESDRKCCLVGQLLVVDVRVQVGGSHCRFISGGNTSHSTVDQMSL